MAEVKTTNTINVIEVVQAGPRGPQWSGLLTGSAIITGSFLLTGSLTVSGSNSFNNYGPFYNSGSIDVSGSAYVSGSGSFYNISSSGLIEGNSLSASSAEIPNMSATYYRNNLNPTQNYISWFGDEFRVYTPAGNKFGIDHTMAEFKVPLTASTVSASGGFIGEYFEGKVTGSSITGSVTGSVLGNFTGSLSGSFTGSISGSEIFGVNITGSSISSSGDIIGNLTGSISGSSIIGNLTGSLSGSSIIGNLTGSLSGSDIITNNINTSIISASSGISAFTASFDRITAVSNNSTQDTYISLGNDRMDFTCGGTTFCQYQEGSQDTVKLGSTGDVDVTISAAGSFNKFFVSGENGRIAVNTGTVTLAQFTVKGDISGSGNLEIEDNLKVQGSEVDFTNLPSSDPGVQGRLFTSGSTGAGIPKQVWVSGG